MWTFWWKMYQLKNRFIGKNVLKWTFFQIVDMVLTFEILKYSCQVLLPHKSQVNQYKCQKWTKVRLVNLYDFW